MRKEFQYIIIASMLLSSFFLAQRSAAFIAENSRETAADAANPVCIVIDAGHGGNDPGKIGVNQILEKDINLSIACKLQKMLENKGVRAVLTRSDDQTLADPNASNTKKEDMKNRVNLITQYQPALTVSIHQNSYPDASVCGPQVFYYAKSSDAQSIADTLQSNLNEMLAPQNARTSKANEEYYLLKNTPTPTVIVECGFLSNPNEAALLSSTAYQYRVARSIYLGICRALSLT